MKETHYIDGKPVTIDRNKDMVRITFDELNTKEINETLDYIAKMLKDEPVMFQPETMEELVEITFNDVTVRIIDKNA